MVLIAVVPYAGQDRYFKTEHKQKYADILHHADTVSYTHLDVYKRQLKEVFRQMFCE